MSHPFIHSPMIHSSLLPRFIHPFFHVSFTHSPILPSFSLPCTHTPKFHSPIHPYFQVSVSHSPILPSFILPFSQVSFSHSPSSSPHTDAISCLGVAGIADLQEVKKWIGKTSSSNTTRGVCHEHLPSSPPMHMHMHTQNRQS